ncbi:MAG: hypothetical protein ETSY1_18320 [Candidatus Entotheonella factor]|uniref:DUF29 domain-containing protein n=1 Tax=Entotheonella factor TaxID=1429438 RepID=W4LKV4_ENTF1|nr:DUF29 domain-containing protein [Candidatus Entotheonella palauensis]ETW98544.1 MAG: hypothetical protein ETSY1_18320 [Candidatus Entotheonella factor]
MSRRDRRELASRLAVLIMHLLKWRYQPIRRSRSWYLTINEQRQRLKRLLRNRPSLAVLLSQILADSYSHAYGRALAETRLPETVIPHECPWTLEQVLDEAFWPEGEEE